VLEWNCREVGVVRGDPMRSVSRVQRQARKRNSRDAPAFYDSGPKKVKYVIMFFFRVSAYRPRQVT